MRKVGRFSPDEIADAEDVLGFGMTKEEVDTLTGIRHELSSNIRWGRAVEESLPAFLSSLESLITERSALSKRVPIDELFRPLRAFLTGTSKQVGDKRMRYILLHLSLKLLGALKTRIRQELASQFPELSAAQEDEMRRVIMAQEMDLIEQEEEEEQEELFTSTPVIIGPSGKPITLELSARVAGVHPEEPAVLTPEVPGEVTIHSILSRRSREDVENDRGPCDHHKKRIHYDQVKMVRKEFCTLCRTYVAEYPISTTPTGPAKKDKCVHPGARWVAGQAGKVAVCTEEGCGEIVPNPETYQWIKAGLEPYGDDPGADEVIKLGASLT